MTDKTIAIVGVEMRISELGKYACNGNFRGGWGDLYGHIVEGAAKNGIRVIPITYFYPVHWQTNAPINYGKTPAHLLYDLDVDIHFQKRTVQVYTINRAGVPVFGINDPEAGILYPGDKMKKLRQAAFLGRAVHALLKKRGEKPDIVWCNEWMTAPVIPNLKDDEFFRDTKYLFTLHTLVPEALEIFSKDWYENFALNGKYLPDFKYNCNLDPTLAGVRFADMITGVSEEHGELCKSKYPEFSGKIEGINNGLSLEHVLSHHLKANNETNPTKLGLWRAHLKDKAELFGEIELLTRTTDEPGIKLDPRRPTIGLCRRIGEYKNQIMFENIVHAICSDRHAVTNEKRGLGANLVIGGVAHENDAKCRGWMEKFKSLANDPALKGKFVYIPEYSEDLRALITTGCDIHVACPWPGWEACGTSDIIAKANGNPNVATKSGGIRNHGTEFEPQTRTGDTLFIEPYNSDTLYLKLGRCCGWFYDFLERDDELWLDLRMNNFLAGKELDVTRMIENYDKLCFEPLLNDKKNSG